MFHSHLACGHMVLVIPPLDIESLALQCDGQASQQENSCCGKEQEDLGGEAK